MMEEHHLTRVFHELTEMKYPIYNGLFLSLPFEFVADFAMRLPDFHEHCRHELNHGKSAHEIVNQFFRDLSPVWDKKRQLHILLFLLQLIERQQILFESLENSAFGQIHDLHGPGSLEFFTNRLLDADEMAHGAQILQRYSLRICLAPYLFPSYPSAIHHLTGELTEAMQQGDPETIRNILWQLGKTPLNRQAPPHFNTYARSVIDQLTQIWYPTVRQLQILVSNTFHSSFITHLSLPPQFELAFSATLSPPGTLKADALQMAAATLKRSVIDLYLKEVQELKHHLTFEGISKRIADVETALKLTLEHMRGGYENAQELLDDLIVLRSSLEQDHQGLYLDQLDRFIITVRTFGFHLASVDLEIDAYALEAAISDCLTFMTKSQPELLPKTTLAFENYQTLTLDDKLKVLNTLLQAPVFSLVPQINKMRPATHDLLSLLGAAQQIQKSNGTKGLSRLLISSQHHLVSILEAMLLLRWMSGTSSSPSFDFVPMLNRLADVEYAPDILQSCWDNPFYQQHLAGQHHIQTIGFDFSSIAQDCGYLGTAWETFKAKQALTLKGEHLGIEVAFFDGSGGFHQQGVAHALAFYRSIGDSLNQRHLQLALSGEALQAYFQTPDSTAYQLEQLFTGGLEHHIFPNPLNQFSDESVLLMEDLAKTSIAAYRDLKNDPELMSYLANQTPLQDYENWRLHAENHPIANPADIPAAVWELCWKLIRQPILGFYGVGTALQKTIERGNEPELKLLFRQSLFFRTLIQSAQEALEVSFFPLTQHAANDKLWQKLENEHQLSRKNIFKIAGQFALSPSAIVAKESRRFQENLVLPALVIQQYALESLRGNDKGTAEDTKTLRRIMLKAMAINAKTA